MVVSVLAVASQAAASPYRGQVTFGGLPLPGATVTATQNGKKFATVTNQQGGYLFPDLANGTWTIEIEMTGFSTIRESVRIGPNTPAAKWQMNMLPLAQMKAISQASGKSRRPAQNAGLRYPPASSKSPRRKKPAVATVLRRPPASNAAASEEAFNQLSSPGFLINGSVHNAAASPFAQLPAFGNRRSGPGGLYNGGIGMILDNSGLDAAPYSLTGQRTPKPVYNRVTGIATFGGPLRIPHILQDGPDLFAAYEWTRNVTDTTQSALLPDLAERNGDFSQALNAVGQAVQIFDPSTGLPFAGNAIPQSRISPQARALLGFYPLPNFTGSPKYNYQIPIVTDANQQALQSRLDQMLNAKDQLYGGFAFMSSKEASPNLFGFLDKTDMLGINSNVHWSHELNQMLYLDLGYQFSRLGTRVTPYFENRENISGEAGISGNNQDPMNWGPPTLSFASGIAGLADSEASFDRNQTSAWSYSLLWNHGLHDIEFGGDFRRQEFNYLSQQNPRGAFTFTGAATEGSRVAGSGYDVADFLLGIPDTSSIAFGNADKYFRESVYDAYTDDDYKVRPDFTLNAGIRWEYGAPMTELYNRLVNLDTAPGFSAVAPVVANSPGGPIGPLTGQRYPDSLIHPDWTGFEPRIGIAWRPLAGSSVVVRAGYGIYDDTSVYQTIALQMAQQAPLSKSSTVANTAGCLLSLANGFTTCPSITPDNFAIDPNFQVGYAQNWDVELQRDLPWSMQLTATYLGTKGTRGLQEFLPNTYPAGAVNPCPACPSGFTYFASNGNSSREAGQIQLRRRLENGLTATLQYTYSKAIDDDSQLGGQGATTPESTTVVPWLMLGAAQSSGTSQSASTIAQNWRDLEAERSLSAFDQRNLLNAQLQYTTGMGVRGGTLMSGWRGTLFKEWTFLMQISAGSGLPETPVYLAPVPGTGVTGSIRPEYTGAPLYSPPAGLDLNPAAYAAPLAGQWGNAGRYSIIGPAQFSLDASLGRTFRLRSRYNLDVRLDSTNALNHVTFTTWNTAINGTQFGLPAAANAMRSVQATVRLRF
ncbi:MAG TPA: carboxypeptidase-like regulatory domain-containing protein [Terriglobia bacterium]|nr:carboxypeptidase-like regulatory domain-containing protein [Terriglobia bacterium]